MSYVEQTDRNRSVGLDTDELIKRYGKRYAFEWFVRAQDDLYFRISKGYINKKCKKITALAVTNAVITLLLLLAIWKRSK